jgi:hypothetical protein
MNMGLNSIKRALNHADFKVGKGQNYLTVGRADIG